MTIFAENVIILIKTGCETGKYGRYCNHTCSHCMNNYTCDIESGKCDDWACARENFLPPFCISKLN